MIRRLLVDDIEVLENGSGTVTSCLMVSGVGYEVMMPEKSFSTLQERINAGETPVPVETFHQISEIAENLFGFSSLPEHHLFTMLLQIKGVGKKTGLLLVQALTLAEVKKAVRDYDLTCFTDVPGIGKQTAERIYVSLKSQLGV